MKILIFPYAKNMRNDQQHPKNYPWWPELVDQLIEQGHTLIQTGVGSDTKLVDDFIPDLKFNEICNLMKICDTWISMDSFGQHLGWYLGIKGIAIFGQSDPIIFGHPENINLLKSRDYLRPNQFWLWEQAEYNPDAFVPPAEIVKVLNKNFVNNI